jgi:hypothetical protein
MRSAVSIVQLKQRIALRNRRPGKRATALKAATTHSARSHAELGKEKLSAQKTIVGSC